MPLRYFSLGLLIITSALAFALNGCVAALPLGQLAMERTAAAGASCATGSNCASTMPNGSFSDLSKGLSDSFHGLTGDGPQAVTAGVQDRNSDRYPGL